MATERRYPMKYSDLLMKAVANKVRRGLPLKQANVDYGIGIDAIRRVAREGSERPYAHYPISVELRRRMCVMRAQGMTCKEIASACGVSINTAWRHTYNFKGDR